MRKRHLIALAISAALHAALIAGIAIAGVWIFGELRLAPGDTVSVFIAPGGNDGQGGPVGTVARPRPQAAAKKTTKTATESATAPTPQPMMPESSAAAASPGGSGSPGVGGGEGGIGRGDPRLSQIWRRINASKYYPEAARRDKLEGAPRVTFAINEDGSIGWARLAASSGSALLDDAALQTVQRAAPLPYYAGPITLAVRYSLNR